MPWDCSLTFLLKLALERPGTTRRDVSDRWDDRDAQNENWTKLLTHTSRSARRLVFHYVHPTNNFYSVYFLKEPPDRPFVRASDERSSTMLPPSSLVSRFKGGLDWPLTAPVERGPS